jgi:hypothetical protein
MINAKDIFEHRLVLAYFMVAIHDENTIQSFCCRKPRITPTARKYGVHGTI